LYERVSYGIKDTDRSKSVEDQNRDNARAVDRFAWTVAGRYADPGLSASRFAKRNRPEWDRLLADVRAGRLDVVVMWASTRGSRELEAWAAFLNACRANGVKIYVTNDDYLYDLGSDRDWSYLASEGIKSASESDRISSQSRRGIASSAERGEPFGRIPYGYTRTYPLDPTHPKGKRPTQHKHPEESPVVEEVIGRLAQGHSVLGILRDLTERGIMCRDGTPWVHSSLTDMAKNVTYIAKRRHSGGPLLDGNWPALVEEDIFWAAQAVLSDPARRTTGGRIKPGRSKWLLSFLAVCGVCKGPLSVKFNTRAAGRVPYYRCSSDGCVSAPAEWMDELVTVGVVGFCAQSPLYELLTRGDDQEASTARAEAAAERDRLADFEERAISGAISAGAYARIASGIEARIAELEEQARKLSTPAPLRDLMADVSGATPEERYAEIHERWKGMELASQRSVIRAIFAPALDVPPGPRTHARFNATNPARFRMPLSASLAS